MKTTWTIGVVLSLLLVNGCGNSTETSPSNPETTESPTESIETPPDATAPDDYVLFTMNAQEFVYFEQSIDTMNRLIDLHETYDIPVDIYVTEDIFRVYEEEAPELIERFKASDVVAISYHYRPPTPYHNNAYDPYGLETLPASDLKTILLDYEEHAKDPITGETTEEPGGYEHVKDVMGYAPVIAGMAVGNRTVGEALGEIYEEKGARFVIDHDRTITLGEEKFGLPLRPETIEVKLFEKVGEDIETFLSDLWTANTDEGPRFMNLKVHDNDFIATESAWLSIYLKRKPPYNLDHGTTERDLLSETDAEALWTTYEDALRFVSEHSETYTAINAFDLVEMLK